MTRALLVLTLLFAARADAAPPFPFDELLSRAETVFVGELVRHDATSVEFKVITPLRGKPGASPRFDYDEHTDPAGLLPDKVTRYVVISQGDDYWGKPTTHARLGQGTIGQISFRGWILLPIVGVDVDGAFLVRGGRGFVKVKLADVRGIVARSPYRAKRV